MSQTKQTKTHTSTYEVITETKCDLCGAVTHLHDGEDANWRYQDAAPTSESRFADWDLPPNRAIVTIALELADVFGSDGGVSETYTYDICAKCFVDTLMPWLANQGIQPRTEERDW